MRSGWATDARIQHPASASSSVPARNAAPPPGKAGTAPWRERDLPGTRTSARVQWKRPSFRSWHDPPAFPASARLPRPPSLPASGRAVLNPLVSTSGSVRGRLEKAVRLFQGVARLPGVLIPILRILREKPLNDGLKRLVGLGQPGHGLLAVLIDDRHRIFSRERFLARQHLIHDDTE